MDNRFKETIDYLRNIYRDKVESGIVLGTGLGGLIREIDVIEEIPYESIPHFPVSTVESHKGKLIFGKIGNQKIVAMQGRFHFYEGYSMEEVTYPIRIMKLLGAQNLFLSNACGALNLDYKKGDLMVIEDHINLQTANPLIGQNNPQFGPRFPDMSEPYNNHFINIALTIAKEENIKVHKGVYVAVNGPNLETRAEYRFLKIIGADVVGMSTVPEVIVARHMGMKVFAISLVTDECNPICLQPVTIEEVIEVAHKAEPYLTKILVRLVKEQEKIVSGF